MKKIRMIPPLAAGLAALLSLSAHSAPLPDAYMHAFASGPENKQLVVRLPMHQQPSGKLVGQMVDGEHESQLSGTPYAWEVIGEYRELCPTVEKGKLQHLLILDDDSIVFTCERSKIFIKHPNRGYMAEFDPTITDLTTPRSTLVSYRYPEIALDVTPQLTATFDDNFDSGNYNRDYGIALSYNAKDQVIYVGLEDKVQVIDLKMLAEAQDDETITAAQYFYPLQYENKPVVALDPETEAERAQIISLALIEHPGMPPYLFTSSATQDKKDNRIPLSMFSLGYDGRSVLYQEEPQAAAALRLARLDYNGKQPVGKGLKADVTYIASDTAPNSVPVLTAHLHHNQIVSIAYPHVSSQAVTEMIRSPLDNPFDDINFQPDDYNELLRGAKAHELNPMLLNPHLTGITRLSNYPVPTRHLTPNIYSYDERIANRIRNSKSPKIWLNNDMLSVYGGFVYSIPWKEDVTQTIMTYPLRSAGWHTDKMLPEKNWSVSAELPDILYMQRSDKPLYTEEVVNVTDDNGQPELDANGLPKTKVVYHLGDQDFNLDKQNLPDWFTGATYWSAVYMTPASGQSYTTQHTSQ